MGFNHFFFVELNSKTPTQTAAAEGNQSEEQMARQTTDTNSDTNDVSTVFANVMQEMKAYFMVLELMKEFPALFTFFSLRFTVETTPTQVEVQTDGSSPVSDSDLDYLSDTDLDYPSDSDLEMDNDEIIAHMYYTRL